MRCYTKPHQLYCGIDLPARAMYVCLLRQNGAVVLPRHRHASSDALLKAIAPSRDGIVVAVAGLFPWYWLANLGAREGLPFVLGHALPMPAIHIRVRRRPPAAAEEPSTPLLTTRPR